MTRECRHCGATFTTENYRRWLCSPECRAARQRVMSWRAHVRAMENPEYRSRFEDQRRAYRRRPEVSARLNARRQARIQADPVYRDHMNKLSNNAHHRRRDRGVLQLVIGTPEDYERLMVEQGGLCAICRRPETGHDPSGRIKRLAVDHDHETGATRGLLCQRCNAGLGQMNDDLETIERAAAYLRGHLTEQHKAAAMARFAEAR